MKRILNLLLILCISAVLLPVSAYAEDEHSGQLFSSLKSSGRETNTNEFYTMDKTDEKTIDSTGEQKAGIVNAGMS